MIIQQIAYNTINSSTGVVAKLLGAMLPKLADVPTNDTCYCKYECEYTEKVFASADGVDWWKNDKSTLPLFQKLVLSDTIVFELYKDGVKVADISDNTLGNFYDAFSLAPLYVGFVADWFKIKTIHGYGIYDIQVISTILGTAKTYYSQYFKLMPYSDDLANNTVRIESYQTGNILSSAFDYSLLLPELPNGWYQSYRIAGMFGWKTPKLEVKNYLTSNYKLTQIQDKISIEYTLETNLLPSTILNILMYDNILSNEFFVTDYTILNSEVFRRISVYPIDISKIEHLKHNRNQIISIKFADKTANIIKSNN